MLRAFYAWGWTPEEQRDYRAFSRPVFPPQNLGFVWRGLSCTLRWEQRRTIPPKRRRLVPYARLECNITTATATVSARGRPGKSAGARERRNVTFEVISGQEQSGPG